MVPVVTWGPEKLETGVTRIASTNGMRCRRYRAIAFDRLHMRVQIGEAILEGQPPFEVRAWRSISRSISWVSGLTVSVTVLPALGRHNPLACNGEGPDEIILLWQIPKPFAEKDLRRISIEVLGADAGGSGIRPFHAETNRKNKLRLRVRYKLILGQCFRF